MSLIKCPYCNSHVRPDRIGNHLATTHSDLDLGTEEVRGIEASRQNPEELSKYLISNPKASTKKSKKKKKNKKALSASSAAQKTRNQTYSRSRKPKTHILNKVKVSYRQEVPDTSCKTAKPSKSTEKKITWTPILSRKNQYPIINCKQCGDEVYLVPTKMRNGKDGQKKYDINPFAPHNCDDYMRDPLDDPRTIRIFQPRNNPYKY